MRKNIIIILILLLIGGGVWLAYTKSKTNKPAADQTTGFKSLFPFGNNTTGSNNTSDGMLSQSDRATIDISQKENSLFKQLTSHTIAGYSVFTVINKVTTPPLTPKGKPVVQTTTDHVLRYISRDSGYVYEINNGETPIQVSNIYVPNIYEGFFVDGGKTALLRFLRDDEKTIATYLVPVPDKNTDGTRTQKGGFYLPDGISSIAVSPDGGTLARLSLESGTSVLSSTTTLNTGRKELLRNPFHEWLVSWGGQKNIYLQTKASATADGFLYKVDDINHRLTRILGNIAGLTTSISPNGTYILYSNSTSRGFVTKLLTTKTGVVRSVGNSILPEKCAWLKNEDIICAGGGILPEGKYPDDWYKGVIGLSDKIFRIYTSANVFDVLYTPTDSASFDITNLQLDEDNHLLYFIDKPTGILWQFTL